MEESQQEEQEVVERKSERKARARPYSKMFYKLRVMTHRCVKISTLSAATNI